jgi:hypothetical protein
MGLASVAYRDLVERTIAERQQRMAIVRAVTRVEMGLGTAALIVAGAILLSPLGPTFFRPRNEILLFGIILFGIIGIVSGFVWMWRIRYEDPEKGPSNWRSH